MAKPTLFTSNRLEKLAHRLASTLRTPVSSPFQPEIIVVQSQSLARWLRLELAAAHGISANYVFPFPKHFAKLIFMSAFPGLADENSSFEPDTLVWVILKNLPALLEQPEFAPLKQYLGDDPDPRKLFQLSDRIARLFDQYIIFRPDLILKWDKNQGEGWQPILWRGITRTLGKAHPAALHKTFLEFATQNLNAKFTRPAERISIFGISALPKFYLELFDALASQTRIDLYLLQPCAQWWGDISSDREAEKSLQRAGRTGDAAEGFHFERGNRLLASLGQQGRDFLNLIHELDWPEHDLSEAIAEDSLLHTIQADILNLHDRGTAGEAKKTVAPDDASIQIHNCHSPLREMEVLYDHMLDWFAKDSTLTPRDILVMTPDIETYAPFIQAVFDSPETEAQRIPLSIADRGARGQSQIVETFLQILALPQTRLGATTILSLLETPAVRARFGILGSDLMLIRSWIESSGIHWGKDAAHRAGLGLPEISEHTWASGLDRLNENPDAHGLTEETKPVLGRFTGFLERVFDCDERLKAARTLSGWADFLRDVLETFFQPGEQTESDLRPVRVALAGFNRNEILSGYDGAVPLDAILEPLTNALDQDLSGTGYLMGGVTFCGLKPMRSIPFRIICLVGLNDGGFPRTDSWLSFDLMAQQPRVGDRSGREDDRYLFLETLISAREKLYLSYTGQSIRDNSESPPSVLMNQLLDYIEQGFQLPGADIADDLIVTKHRLQAFSSNYFSGARLFSYSQDNLRASQAVPLDRTSPKVFLAETLSAPGDEFRKVTVDTLIEFFANPARFLAIRRLGIRLSKLEAGLEDDEPFALERLQDYQLQQQLLEARISGQSFDSVRAAVAGALPAGIPGDAAFATVRTAVEHFHERLKPHLAAVSATPTAIELAIGDFQVSGEFKEVTPLGPLTYRCARVKAKDLLRAWIRHVAWNTARPENQPLTSRLIAADVIYDFDALENPRPVLESLLQTYWRGLTQPLKFFPQSSHAFAAATGKTDPQKKARAVWTSGDYAPGESDDEYFDLLFRHADPLDADFNALAREIFLPLLAHAKEIEP